MRVPNGARAHSSIRALHRNVARFRLHPSAVADGPALQPLFDVVFEVTNGDFSHAGLKSYHDSGYWSTLLDARRVIPVRAANATRRLGERRQVSTESRSPRALRTLAE